MKKNRSFRLPKFLSLALKEKHEGGKPCRKERRPGHALFLALATASIIMASQPAKADQTEHLQPPASITETAVTMDHGPGHQDPHGHDAGSGDTKATPEGTEGNEGRKKSSPWWAALIIALAIAYPYSHYQAYRWKEARDRKREEEKKRKEQEDQDKENRIQDIKDGLKDLRNADEADKNKKGPDDPAGDAPAKTDNPKNPKGKSDENAPPPAP